MWLKSAIYACIVIIVLMYAEVQGGALGKNGTMRRTLKTLLITIITAIVILGIVWAIMSLLSGGWVRKHITERITPVQADVSDEELTDYVKDILAVIRDRDYERLSTVVHPEYGVIFSPYATVTLSTDKCFTDTQVAGFADNNKKYIWGIFDGSGEPIEMTPAEYFDRFVYDTDFINCSNFGIDEVLREGNSLENIDEVFSNARYVDCYMPDPKGETEPEWRSLRLVFEEYNGGLWLTAIVHSEYTI